MASASSSLMETRNCAICIGEIQLNDVVSKLNCNHEYHQDCLQPWLDAQHNTCPLDRERITSINGVALEQPEIKEQEALVVVENPMEEAQALYQRSLRVIHNPSIHSADPVENQASRVRSHFFSLFPPIDILRENKKQ